jgi:hypothetical protein
MFNDRQMAIFDAVGKAIEGYDMSLDRDRQILEALSVW